MPDPSPTGPPLKSTAAPWPAAPTPAGRAEDGVGAVEDHAHSPFLAVLQQEHDRPIEVRIGQRWRGDKEVVAERRAHPAMMPRPPPLPVRIPLLP